MPKPSDDDPLAAFELPPDHETDPVRLAELLAKALRKYCAPDTLR